MSRPTLGGGRAHVFVTRHATLQFQAVTRQPFEEARRELTRRVLDAHRIEGESSRLWEFRVGVPLPADELRRAVDPAGAALYTFHAYVRPDGPLLLVCSVTLAQDAPGVYREGPPSGGDE